MRALFMVTRDGKPIGVSFAQDGVAALRHMQRTSGVEGRLSGGWRASPISMGDTKPDPWDFAAGECLREGRVFLAIGAAS